MLSEATTELAIVENITGQPATEFIIPGGDYAAYRESHLAPVLDIEEILIAAQEARDAEEAEAAARGRSRGIRRRRDGTSTSRGAAGVEVEGLPVIPLTLECTRASGQRFVVPIPESEFPEYTLPAGLEVWCSSVLALSMDWLFINWPYLFMNSLLEVFSPLSRGVWMSSTASKCWRGSLC